MTAATYVPNTSIDMQGVDTIAAYDETYINGNLALLLKTGRTSTGGALSDVQLNTGQNSWLKGTVSALAVKLGVANAPQRVKFLISFKTGTMDYTDLQATPPGPQTADISGLVIAYEVDLNVQDVLNAKNLPPAVSKDVAARISNVTAGSFTIKQVLMDVSQAALSAPDPGDTVYPAAFTAAAKAALQAYMASYVAEVSQAGGTTLGYAVTVQNPNGANDPVASFPPTSLELLVNPYQPVAGDPPTPAFDCLTFAMMSNGAAMPAKLGPWANFVRPGDGLLGILGVMGVRGGLFRDFLCKTLSPVVCAYSSLYDRTDSLNVGVSAATGAFTPTALGGTCTGGPFTSHNEYGSDNADYGLGVTIDMAVTPGSNSIKIVYTLDFSVALTHFYLWRHSVSAPDYSVSFSIPVTYDIALLGVSDGALVVNVTKSIPPAPPNVISRYNYFWLISSETGSYPWTNAGVQAFDKAISDSIDGVMPGLLPKNLEGAIAKALTLTPFVFPGGAQIYLKNPTFSTQGDLLAGLSLQA